MITETGRIVALHDGSAWVQTQRDSTCSRCSLQSGCGQRILGGAFGGANAHIVVPLAGPDLPAVDDEVEIGIPEAGLLKSACLAYLAPLAGFLLGMFAGHWIFAETGAALGAAVGLASAIAFIRLALSSGSIDVAQPVLLRRLPSATSAPASI